MFMVIFNPLLGNFFKTSSKLCYLDYRNDSNNTTHLNWVDFTIILSLYFLLRHKKRFIWKIENVYTWYKRIHLTLSIIIKGNVYLLVCALSTAKSIARKGLKICIKKRMNGFVCIAKPDFRSSTPNEWLIQGF